MEGFIMENLKPIEVLLIEDNRADVLLIKMALSDFKRIKNINVVSDGLEASDFLFQREKFINASTPDLIILDLNLPKKNGIELLAEIKNEDRLKNIPVAILTSSKAEDDILGTYKLHASCYIIKSTDVNKYIQNVKSINDLIKKIV